MASKNTKKSTTKSKKSTKAISKTNLSRVSINMAKTFNNKVKQFALKHDMTIHELVNLAVKEYMNKPVGDNEKTES